MEHIGLIMKIKTIEDAQVALMAVVEWAAKWHGDILTRLEKAQDHQIWMLDKITRLQQRIEKLEQ